jgi:hypothetical protein
MEKEEFNQQLIQLIIGLQSTAWMALGKQMNPLTKKTEVNIDLAKDSIDTLLMLKEKTKGNLTEVEKEILEGAMQDLEINFVDVKKSEELKKTEEKSSNQ